MPRGDRQSWGGKRTTSRPDAKKAGPTPNLIASASKIADQMRGHAPKFSDETLNALRNQLSAALMWIDVEFTRREDLKDD